MSATENFNELPSSLGNQKQAFIALVPRNLVKTSIDVNLSQNDYPVFKNQTVRFFYPSTQGKAEANY